jgi:predicted transglutaminase-like cysteine proteinase
MNKRLFALTIILGFMILKPLYCEETKDLPGLFITGIFKGGQSMAIVNEQILKEGDMVKGAKIIYVADSYVKFEYNGSVFIRELGQGVEKKKPISVEIVHKQTQPSQEDKEIQYRSEHGSYLYKEAQDNYSEAVNEEKSFNKTKAFVHYEIALKDAQEAFVLVDSSQKIELTKMIEKCRNRISELEEEREKINNLRFARLESPSAISQWLKTNIKYKSDWSVHHEEEYWQSPKETLVLKTGDCEDFAFFAQALLNEIGISSSVISVQHMKEGKKKGHAICIFPKDRPRGYFSGYQLHTSNKEVDANLIIKLYPDWISINELDLFGHSQTPLYKRR